MKRKYAASAKGERTEFCVEARNEKECDRLADRYTAMFIAVPARVELVSELVTQ
jgi:hypothetical protein